jgi:hypothetical protein
MTISRWDNAIPAQTSGLMAVPRGSRAGIIRPGRTPQPRTAASIAAMSILPIVIMASNARLAAAGSGPVTASVSATGVICQDTPHLSWHQPQAFSPPAVANDGVPVAVGLHLIRGGHLKREGDVVLDRWPAVEPHAGNAHHREHHGQHIPGLAGRVVRRSAVHRVDPGVRKRRGIKPGRLLGVAVVPDADGVLGYRCHATSPENQDVVIGSDGANP